MRRRADAAGWLRLALPADYGGRDASNLEMAIIREHLAHRGLGLAGALLDGLTARVARRHPLTTVETTITPGNTGALLRGCENGTNSGGGLMTITGSAFSP